MIEKKTEEDKRNGIFILSVEREIYLTTYLFFTRNYLFDDNDLQQILLVLVYASKRTNLTLSVKERVLLCQ